MSYSHNINIFLLCIFGLNLVNFLLNWFKCKFYFKSSINKIHVKVYFKQHKMLCNKMSSLKFV